MKQYTHNIIRGGRYDGMSEFNIYENGELESSYIVPTFELLDFVDKLQMQGYTEAYDLEEAEEELKYAILQVEKARKNPLIKRQ